MARITVEDCLDNVDNRFELVLVASKRARQLAMEGRTPMVAPDNDKPTVLALREISAGFITRDILKQVDDEQDTFSVEDELAAFAAAQADAIDL